jgi:hypothetical protein
MATSWLGAEQLTGLLDGGARVVISNRAADTTALVVLAVAVALHGDDGSRRLKTAHGLSLHPGESAIFDGLPPAATPLVAAEAVLQFTDGETHRMIEAYAMIEGTPDAPLDAIEFGIVETNGTDTVGATPLVDAPEFAVFARVES